MVRLIASHYASPMIMTEQWQPAGANRVIFRRLNMQPVHGDGTALRRAIYQPLPQLNAERVARVAGKSLSVPNWAVAISCVAALGLSVALSAGMVNAPADAASSYSRGLDSGTASRLVWSGSMALA